VARPGHGARARARFGVAAEEERVAEEVEKELPQRAVEEELPQAAAEEERVPQVEVGL